MTDVMMGCRPFAGALALALMLATAACDRAAGPAEVQPPELPVLLQQAWERTLREHGEAEAEARFSVVHARNAELKGALRTRELATVRAAQHALRAEQLRLIAASLGADGPQQVLDAVADVLEEVRQREAAARAEGRDTGRLEAALQEALAAHGAGLEALSTGSHERALEHAFRAVDLVSTARVAARTL